MNEQCQPYAIMRTIFEITSTAQLNSVRPDYDTVNPEIDIFESTDEPDVPEKDKWSSSFINVDKVERLIAFEDNKDDGNNDGQESPVSHKSYRSNTTYISGLQRARVPSLSYKKKMQFMKAAENYKTNPVPLKIEVHQDPVEVKRLRERKERQIQHQKWEEAERKRIKEEERLDKLKK